jgi:hypothetical protein
MNLLNKAVPPRDYSRSEERQVQLHLRSLINIVVYSNWRTVQWTPVLKVGLRPLVLEGYFLG